MRLRARERGIGVIVNRPFRQGDLIDRVKRHPLPGWAAEIDCANWAQVLLKFIVSHPAVTCAIPATSKVAHLQENMGGMRGAQPDEAPGGATLGEGEVGSFTRLCSPAA